MHIDKPIVSGLLIFAVKIIRCFDNIETSNVRIFFLIDDDIERVI